MGRREGGHAALDQIHVVRRLIDHPEVAFLVHLETCASKPGLGCGSVERTEQVLGLSW